MPSAHSETELPKDVSTNVLHNDVLHNELAIRVHPLVQAALDANQPVVALESTIIAHGMPYPQNLQTARALEKHVRSNGATPATVALINGVPHIGLSQNHLHLLATNPSVRKLSRRDIPAAIADSAHGATTVSATMFLSSLAGIQVFATGGIGGVHRGVASSLDISADITALASTPQLVVCAGAKSILDVPKTLEALETASVPVLVLHHDQFPAFYTRNSGLPAPRRVESELDVAKIVHVALSMPASSGILLAVPVPTRSEADAELVQQATSKALREMETQSLRPNEVTPFLLKRIAQLTGGASLQTNIQLAQNNAGVAARVSVLLSRLRAIFKSEQNPPIYQQPRHYTVAAASNVKAEKSGVLVVGGTALDIHCDATNHLVMGSSNGGRIRQCAGGVGKNVAEAASIFGNMSVSFLSCVGDDVAGRAVLSVLQRSGFRTDSIKQYPGKRTGVCCVVHNVDGDLTVAVADFEDMFDSSSSFIEDVREDLTGQLRSAKIVCMDANFSPRDMRQLVRLCRQQCVPVWYEPTTSVKCKRIVEADVIGGISYMSPNESELVNIADSVQGIGARGEMGNGKFETVKETHKGMNAMNSEQEYTKEKLLQSAKVVLEAGKGLRILCTRGARGVTRFTLHETGDVKVDEFAGMKIRDDVLRNTTGAGDCFAGRCLAGIARGEEEDEAIRASIAVAGRCCMSEETVPRSLFPTKL